MSSAVTSAAVMDDAAPPPHAAGGPTFADTALPNAASAAQFALSDVQARPRAGWVVQTIALALTAAPIIGVALWSVLWVM